MNFINDLNNELENWFLLKHPFYNAFNHGKLPKETLILYAKERFHHIYVFARLISQIHSQCCDMESRQVLLENLIDEERGDNNHPELWKRFIYGISPSTELDSSPELESTLKLIDGFFDLTKSGYSTGLGALYAYERQTPSVSKSKIEALKNHYNITDPSTLEFFYVHEKVDVWHTEELVGLINKLDKDNKNFARNGAIEGAKLLWNFLDGFPI
ncbi:CADD family putative folate metabolism protein [Lyticum sinuosum]|uniref:HemO-like superfamily protein n=1 Tax=Lyticum sinuosum TaxID=1332059 RepID=A0AAE4VKV3_9RICK|nr:CADD family putative folate metabolism protein [Lyticum sinuosum]MDZ5761159.1 HemO-like superfamily protein [Lyticum sinuosum]